MLPVEYCSFFTAFCSVLPLSVSLEGKFKDAVVASHLGKFPFFKNLESSSCGDLCNLMAASAVPLMTYFFILSTAVIGLLYPCIDRHLGEPHKFKREWSSVMRCVAVFVGINHASAVSFLKHAVTRQPTTSLPSTLMVSLSLNVGPVAETPG